MAATLELHFVDHSFPELYQTVFMEEGGEPRVCTRGRFSKEPGDTLSFPLTRAVQAFSMFFLRAALSYARLWGRAGEAGLLVGYPGSPAAVLDHALYKQPFWLLDMFGSDTEGLCVARHLVTRVSAGKPGRKPVALGLNAVTLPYQNIAIVLSGRRITGIDHLEYLLRRSERAFYELPACSGRRKQAGTAVERPAVNC